MTVLRLAYGRMSSAYRTCCGCRRLIPRGLGGSPMVRCRWCQRYERRRAWRAVKEQSQIAGIEARYAAALAAMRRGVAA